MLGRIRSERQCLQKKVLHFSVEKDKITIPKFNKIGAEFQCLIKKGRFPMFNKTGVEFQC